MATRVIWHRTFMPLIRRRLDLIVGNTARALRDVCRTLVSIPYPPASAPGSPAHRRTGAYRRAIFAARERQMEWVYGVKEVEPDPAKPGSNRGWLGLWLELGTGRHRQPYPSDSFSTFPRGVVRMWWPGSVAEDTATTGHQTSMAPRPVLLPTLVTHGSHVFHVVSPGPL